ncbi:uncharacterized protein LOC121737736 [Aricia agestis]|uniref:uncharacterized protein LOC121737736 n=1 Tax=Aricia agestis TaxID=91739 RepID=UPI001C20885F|nr:uncharacterized protein LOC121737736 [Aricia agestis]
MILILVFLIGCAITCCQEPKPLNFPLQGVKLEDRGKPVFEFEGIDYDNLPTKLKDMYTDCEAQNIKCIRHQVALTPVCAVNYYGYWRDFNNICEFHRQNCFYFRDKGMSKFGNDIDSGWLFLQGEGLSCSHEFRRLKDSGLLKVYLDVQRTA